MIQRTFFDRYSCSRCWTCSSQLFDSANSCEIAGRSVELGCKLGAPHESPVGLSVTTRLTIPNSKDIRLSSLVSHSFIYGRALSSFTCYPSTAPVRIHTLRLVHRTNLDGRRFDCLSNPDLRRSRFLDLRYMERQP